MKKFHIWMLLMSVFLISSCEQIIVWKGTDLIGVGIILIIIAGILIWLAIEAVKETWKWIINKFFN